MISTTISETRPRIDLLGVLGILGSFIFFMGFSLLLPVIIDLIYEEGLWQDFVISALIAFIVGGSLWYFFRPKHELRIREGFLVVGLTWFLLSLVGALPFVISGVLPEFTNAVFESMSGLTTTGATVFGGVNSDGLANLNIEQLPKAILFWRSLTHWLGGMGIIVLSIAILPILGIGGMQLFQAESSTPLTDKLTPRVQQTAKLLWIIYVAYTLAEFLLLWLHPSMDWFDSLNHAFSTLGTGGFSTKDGSVADFHSVYVDWIIILFMFLAGINFAMHFRLWHGERGSFFNNREIRFYIKVVFITSVIISLSLWMYNDHTLARSFQLGIFQALSIITTTGFVTDDYQLWNSMGSATLFLLFFTGGCAGSTAGGIKMMRLMILTKNTFREIKQILHPKALLPLTIGEKSISQSTLRTVLSFFILYMLIFAFGALLISMFGYDILTSIGASIATLANIGPAWGEFGPVDNFAQMPYMAKWILIIMMMVGRLELFTVLILFTPAFWKQ